MLLLRLLLLSRFSRVRPCATPQTAAHQAPPAPGFSRQERWSGLPLPSPDTPTNYLQDLASTHILTNTWSRQPCEHPRSRESMHVAVIPLSTHYSASQLGFLGEALVQVCEGTVSSAYWAVWLLRTNSCVPYTRWNSPTDVPQTSPTTLGVFSYSSSFNELKF